MNSGVRTLKPSTQRFSPSSTVDRVRLVAGVTVIVISLAVIPLAESRAAPPFAGSGVLAKSLIMDTTGMAATQESLADTWARLELGKNLPGTALPSRPAILDAWGLEETGGFTAEPMDLPHGPAQNPTSAALPIPQMVEGGLARTLEPDTTLTLRFDRPVGSLRTKGQVSFAVEADTSHQVFRLVPGQYVQGQTYPVQVIWNTTTGEPIPP